METNGIGSLRCVGFVAFVFDVVHGCKIQLVAMITSYRFGECACVSVASCCSASCTSRGVLNGSVSACEVVGSVAFRAWKESRKNILEVI